MLHRNVIETKGFRMLEPAELEAVSGGEDTKSWKDTTVCPIDEWGNPDWFTDDFGEVNDLPNAVGPYTQYWTDGSTWCLYDDNDNLLGEFVEDPDGAITLSFTGTDGDADAGFSVAGTGASGSTNDSQSATLTVTLSRVGG